MRVRQKKERRLSECHQRISLVCEREVIFYHKYTVRSLFQYYTERTARESGIKASTRMYTEREVMCIGGTLSWCR